MIAAENCQKSVRGLKNVVAYVPPGGSCGRPECFDPIHWDTYGEFFVIIFCTVYCLFSWRKIDKGFLLNFSGIIQFVGGIAGGWIFGLSCTCGLQQRFRRNGQRGYEPIGDDRHPWIRATVRFLLAVIRMGREEADRQRENQGYRDNAADERLPEHIRVHVGQEVGRIGQGAADDQGLAGYQEDQGAAGGGDDQGAAGGGGDQGAIGAGGYQGEAEEQGAAGGQGIPGNHGPQGNQEGEGEVRRRHTPPNQGNQAAGAVGPINQPGLGMQFGQNGGAGNVGAGPARIAGLGPNDGVRDGRAPSPLVQEVQGVRHSLRQAAAEAAERIRNLAALGQI